MKGGKGCTLTALVCSERHGVCSLEMNIFDCGTGRAAEKYLGKARARVQTTSKVLSLQPMFPPKPLDTLPLEVDAQKV